MRKKKSKTNQPVKRSPGPVPGKGKQLQNVSITKAAFSGPLPPPQVLEKYDQIVARSADRIIKMAEEQSQHRRRLESAVVNSEIKNSRMGLHYGLLIGLRLYGTSIGLLVE